jgi:hypothetical protein
VPEPGEHGVGVSFRSLHNTLDGAHVGVLHIALRCWCRVRTGGVLWPRVSARAETASGWGGPLRTAAATARASGSIPDATDLRPLEFWLLGGMFLVQRSACI